MESHEISIDLVVFFKSIKWKKVALWAAIGALIGIIIAFSIPQEYTTKVEFAPESSLKNQQNTGMSLSALGALSGMGGMSGMGGTSQNSDGISLRIYPRVVTSTPYLMELYDMEITLQNEQTKPLQDYLRSSKVPWWSYLLGIPGRIVGAIKGAPKQSTVSGDNPFGHYYITREQRGFMKALKSRTEIELNEETWTVNLKARMQDPLVAAIVADSMMTKLRRYMVDYKLTRARATLQNNQRSNDEAYADYMAAQLAFAEATDQNKVLSKNTAQIRIEWLQNEYNVAYSVYQQMANQMAMAKLNLQEEAQIATVIEPAIVSREASSPNKKKIIAISVFLCAFGYLGITFARNLLSQNKQNKLTR